MPLYKYDETYAFSVISIPVAVLVKECPKCPWFKSSMPAVFGHHFKFMKHSIKSEVSTQIKEFH